MKQFFKSAGLILLLLLLYAMLQGLCTIVLFAAYDFFVSGNSTDLFMADESAISFSETHFTLMAIGLILSSLLMLLILHITRLFRLRKGIFTTISLRTLFISTALVFTSMFVLNIFVQFFPLEDQLETQFDGLSHNIFGIISIAFLAPILEEVLFRGAIQGYLTRRMKNPWFAIIISALIFGIFHMNPIQIVYATLLGIVFGWIYYRTGNLLSVIVGHVLNNSIATASMLFLNGADESAVEDGNLGVSLCIFFLFLAISGFLAFRLHRSLPAVPKPWHESDEKSLQESPDGVLQ